MGSKYTAKILANGEVVKMLPITTRHNERTGETYAVDENNGQTYTLAELEALASSGDAAAQCTMGDNYNSDYINDFPKALKWYEKSAEQLHAKALWHLGTFYVMGVERSNISIKQDLDKAIKYFEQSAKEGYLESMLTLGQIYTALTSDFERAVHWLEKAVGYDYQEANEFLEMAKTLLKAQKSGMDVPTADTGKYEGLNPGKMKYK